jgi:hypothetical protein
MRFVLNMVLCVGVLAAIGCGKNDKTQIHEPTAEEIQQQKDAEVQVKAEESERNKKQPKEKTHQQTVDEQERARRK